MPYEDSLYKVRINTPSGEIEVVGGSFDGVPFFVEEACVSGGRNVVTKELPFSNDYVNEDTGGKHRDYPMKFYLLGADIGAQLKKLEDAFSKSGAFELVHPYYGSFQARCIEYTVSFKQSEQEYVTGEVTFRPESEVNYVAKPVTDLRGATKAKAVAAMDSADSSFRENFSILKKAKSVVDSVAGFTDDVLDAIDGARSSLRNVSKFVNEISKIRANISVILASPADFSARIRNLVLMTKETFDDPSDNIWYVNESLSMMSRVRTVESSGSPIADSLNRMLSRMMLVYSASMAVQSLVDCKFKSVDEAVGLQNAVADAFDRALESVDSVDDYMNLSDMEAAALEYLRDVMADIPSVVEVPLLSRRDALSVCFDVYGSLDRLDEILDRNAITDPMCINRESLKVLSK